MSLLLAPVDPYVYVWYLVEQRRPLSEIIAALDSLPGCDVMNANDLIDALRNGGAVIIQNLTINNNTAETIVIGDGATVNRVNATMQPQRPRLAGGVGYQFSHCAPLAEELHGHTCDWRMDDLAQARSKFAREYAAECEAHWSNG